jgi:spermidine/putrescine transport system permease protein
MLTFLPAMTLFYIPDLLGGAKSLLLGNVIQTQFLGAENWPLGSAVSLTLTVVMSLLLWFYFRSTPRSEREAI